MFSKEEKVQYDRQIRLNQFGEESQRELKYAKVAIVGAGALGIPVAMYLGAAGVGEITIIDGDRVEQSNLHRQIAFTTDDIGKNKAQLLGNRIKANNPFIRVNVVEEFLRVENAVDLSENVDYIIDGTDNFGTRYLINDLCVLYDKTNIHGSIQEYSGQVSVFNMLKKDGTRSANYRDLFPEPPNPNEVKNCAENGVIGALPGIIGSMMAMETIKLIVKNEMILAEKLYIYNSLKNEGTTINYSKDSSNPISGVSPSIMNLTLLNQYCTTLKTSTMNTIDVSELKMYFDENRDFQLIDVRERYEFEAGNIGGDHIPLSEIPHRFSEISREKTVIILCRMGSRSQSAVDYLIQSHKFDNLLNLKGGITDWAKNIDPSIKVY
ncbi:MAG: molybdopterin/thiamine biosynthesis adenylyltransferase/rhodanese-related sulfurtransferase [Lentimonas sp.]|jgi:molybdopterin/thiamine biosynthesis adenylyltransferase/rhodanese-related sulfurtransferase